MMPTQSSTLSPSDSPANRLNLLCFLSKKFHLSYRSLLLIPLSLQPPFCFFPLSPPPPLFASTFAAYGCLRSPLSPGGGRKPAGQ